MKLIGLCATILIACLSQASAREIYYQVDFRDVRGLDGARQCSIYFLKGVPAKGEVDRLKGIALQMCVAMDSTHDIILMAGQGEDGSTLEQTQESFVTTTFDHKTKKLKQMTFQQFLNQLK